MDKPKQIRTKLNQVIAKAKQLRRPAILEMPEEIENAPHWLLWVVLIALIGFIASAGWQIVETQNRLQAYLPFL